MARLGGTTTQVSPPPFRPSSGVDSITWGTLQALPAAARPYSEYDIAIIAEILTLAELHALEAARKGKGSGLITLQRLLKAYEVVLPKHGVKAEEDVYYYRFLLKLSLDPGADWWAKFRREAENNRCCGYLLPKTDGPASTAWAPLPTPGRRCPTPFHTTANMHPTDPQAPAHRGLSDGGTAAAGRGTSGGGAYGATSAGGAAAGAAAEATAGRRSRHESAGGYGTEAVAAGGAGKAAYRSTGGGGGAAGAPDGADAKLGAGVAGGYGGDYGLLGVRRSTAATDLIPTAADIVPSAGQAGLGYVGGPMQYGSGGGGYAGGGPQGPAGYGSTGAAFPGSVVTLASGVAPGPGHGTQGVGGGYETMPPAGQQQGGGTLPHLGGHAPAAAYGSAAGQPWQAGGGGYGGGLAPGTVLPALAAGGGPPQYGAAAPGSGTWPGGGGVTHPPFPGSHYQGPGPVPGGASGVYGRGGQGQLVFPTGPGSGPVAPQGSSLLTSQYVPGQTAPYWPGGAPPPGAWGPGASTVAGAPGSWPSSSGPSTTTGSLVTPAAAHAYASTGTQMSAGGMAPLSSMGMTGPQQGTHVMHGAHVTDEEEAAAYADFRRMAGAFRDWRGTAAVVRDTKVARDAAVENWRLAVAFWEVQLVRRMLLRWARHKALVLGKALGFWMSASVRSCFMDWRKTARSLRIMGATSSRHCAARLRSKAMRAWHQYVDFSKHKATGVMKALSYWKGRNLQVCFTSWRLFTDQALINGDNADSFYAHHARKTLMTMWHRAAHREAKHRQCAAQITARHESRLTLTALGAWHGRWATRQRHAHLLAAAGTRMRKRGMGAAFNRWREFVEEARQAKARMQRAIAFALGGSQAKAWNRWREYIQEVHDKKSAAVRSLKHWVNRQVASAWCSWRLAVEWQRENQQIAREHAHTLLAYLQTDAWREWRTWVARRQAKSEIISHYRDRIQAGCVARSLVAWQEVTVRRRLDLQAFNEILKVEVHRLKSTAWRRMQLHWKRAQRVDQVQNKLARSTATRSLRHWRALTHFKRQRRSRRETAVAGVVRSRRARLLAAWRLAAAVSADQRQLVAVGRARSARRAARGALAALRGAVLHAAAQRAGALTAALHWEGRKRAVALAGWRARTAHWRVKTAKWRKAGAHYRGRLMDTAFIGWLGHWQVYQEKLGRALLHLTHTQNLRRSVVMKHWKMATAGLAAKHANVRRALAHWIGGVLGRCFVEWRYQARERVDVKARLTLALVHWYKGSMARAFTRWRDRALYKVELNTKALAYLSVLTGRTAAYALLMLRAHAARKRRSRDARGRYLRNLKGRALEGWRERLFMARVLESQLGGVLRKMLGATLRDAFDAWRHFVTLTHGKRALAFKAAFYWMSSRQRMAFSMLRWYALRKQMSRALVLKYNLVFLQRTIRAWRDMAGYLRGIRLKWTSMLGRTQKQVLHDCLITWREWIELKRSGALRDNKALGHLRNLLMGRAWNSWRDHHDMCTRAKGALRHMLFRNVAAAFNSWWAAVLDKREIMGRAEQAIRRMQNRELCVAFERLRENVSWRQKKRLADGHFKQTRGKQVLQLWRMGAKLQMAVALWSGNTLSLAFDRWRGHCQRKQRLAISARTVAARWSNRLLSSAWQQWWSHVEDRRDARNCIGRALHFWLNRQLSLAWQGWRDYQQWRSNMRMAAAHIVIRMTSKALLGAWNSWLEYMYLMAATKRAVMVWSQRSLSAAFNTWRDQTLHVAHATRTAEELFRSITAMLAGETLTGVFGAWRAHAGRMRRLRIVLNKVLGRHLAIGFFGWSEVAREIKQRKLWQAAITKAVSEQPTLRAMSLLAIERWRAWPLSLALRTWISRVYERHASRQRAAVAVFAYVGGLLRKAFVGWRERTVGQAAWNAKVANVLYSMGGMKLQRAFYFWRALAPYLRHTRGSMALIRARVDARTKREAWAAWRYRVGYSRVARKALAAIAFKTLREALAQWRDATALVKARKQKVMGALGKLLNRLLAEAFATWVYETRAARQLANKFEHAVRFFRNMALGRAWNSWRELIHEKDEARTKLAHAMHFWTHMTLGTAWNQWVSLWQDTVRLTQADVHYYGRLMDNAWIAWRDHVDDSIAMRGLHANRLVVFRRALDCWRQYTLDASKARALALDMAALCALRGLQAWRQMTKARLALQRLYKRRALNGWYQRVLFLQQQRQKLREVAQVLMFGSYARCFRAWYAFTQEQALKRTVFASKQAAIKEALRIGDQIRVRRNHELLEATFQAWRFQVGVYRKVAKRFASIMQRGLSAAFREWRDYVVDIRKANNKALEHFRGVHQERFFLAWREAAPELAQRSLERAEGAQQLWRVRCGGRALRGWRQQARLGRGRMSALLGILQKQVEVESQELLVTSWSGWRQAVAQRGSLMSLADMASKSRRTRVMGEVMMVWQQYVQAMRGDVDLGSPFVSPRSPKQNRRLVKRMAVMMGSTEVDAGSDNSSELFGDIYETDRAREAQAFKAHKQAMTLDGGSTEDDDIAPRPVAPVAAMPARGASYATPHQQQQQQQWHGMPPSTGYAAPTPIPFRGIVPTPSHTPAPMMMAGSGRASAAGGGAAAAGGPRSSILDRARERAAAGGAAGRAGSVGVVPPLPLAGRGTAVAAAPAQPGLQPGSARSYSSSGSSF